MSQTMITEIRMTKKGRYALFCDEGFLFSVDDETLLRHGIKKGSVLDGEELALVRAASDYQRAKNKALDLLGRRDHSKSELVKKLERTFDEHTSKLAVERVCELGLVDDRAFARRYADELSTLRGMSARAVRAKLYEKGVSREIVDEVMGELDVSDADSLRGLVQKKYLRKLAGENGYRLTFAALVRRGFSASDVKAVLREFSDTDTETEDY